MKIGIDVDNVINNLTERVNDWKEFQTTMDKLMPAIEKVRVSLRESEEMICI